MIISVDNLSKVSRLNYKFHQMLANLPQIISNHIILAHNQFTAWHSDVISDNDGNKKWFIDLHTMQ